MIEHFLTNNLGDPNEYAMESGLTPFQLAVIKSALSDNIEAIELLLNKGANILKRTKSDESI